MPAASCAVALVDAGVLREDRPHHGVGQGVAGEVDEGALPAEHARRRRDDDGRDAAGARDGNERRSRVVPVDHPQAGGHVRAHVGVVRRGLELDVDDADVGVRVDEARGDHLAPGVDDARVGGRGDAGPHRLHLAAGEDDGRILERLVLAGDVDPGVGDGDGGRRFLGGGARRREEERGEDGQGRALHGFAPASTAAAGGALGAAGAPGAAAAAGIPRTPSSKSLQGAPTCPRSKTSCPSMYTSSARAYVLSGFVAPDDDVGALARLERPHLAVDAERPRRVRGEPPERVVVGDLDPGRPARRERLGRRLVQDLPDDRRVGVHDGARARLGDEREVLGDAVVGLHLEAPPVVPRDDGDALGRQHVADLVRLERVVEGPHLEPELVGDLEGGQHVVGLVAVPLDQDVAAHDERERLERQVAVRRLVALARAAVAALRGPLAHARRPALPLARVLLRPGEDLAHRADVAHARRRRALLLAVDPLRVLAARHLEDLRRAGEAHRARAALREQVHHDPTSADEVPAAGQDADRRDAARDRALDGRILRPERVLGAQRGVDRIGQLVAVVVGLAVGRGVHAHVRVRIDDPRRDEAPARVHDHRALPGDRTVALADRGDGPVPHQDEAGIEPLPCRREDDGVLDEDRGTPGGRHDLHRRARARLVAGERISRYGRGGAWRRRRGNAISLRPARRDGEHPRREHDQGGSHRERAS